MLFNFKVSILFLLFPILVLSLDPIFNDDVLGLMVFKSGIQDPDSKLGSWNEDSDSPCNWAGVKCDSKTQRVTHLVLDGLSLSGRIGRGLLRLQFLQILTLANNNFTGTIISDLSQLWSLQVIDLSHNNLSGFIPEEFFKQCGSLRSISFAKNSLSGQIPESLTWCASLSSVNLSSNQLSGELPSGIWSLRGIQSLDFSDNLLEGHIPEGLVNLYDLRTLNLRKNRFTGKLPVDIGGCMLLEMVDISENSLSGSFPESLQRLNSCTSLRLRGNSFSGEFPAWIGKLTNLQSLDLSANKFSGRLPTSVGNLITLKELNLSMNHLAGGLPQSMENCTNLLVLDVSQNRLSGILPPWIFKMSLRSISLSSNTFSGEIPSIIGDLSSLLLLNISNNRLFGSIPSNLGELKRIEVLDLSYNNLNGRIPSEIGRATSLVQLRLEKNRLTGIIPTQIKNCSSLTSLILYGNKLSGPFPSAIANLTNLEFVDLSFNNLSGSLPRELTNLSRLVSFNISHNNLRGELPVGDFFNTISPSAVSDNPSLCGAIVNRSCPSAHPKPIVLNPNSSSSSHGSSSNGNHRKVAFSISALVAIFAAALIALGVITVSLLNMHARSTMMMGTSSDPLTLPGEEDFSGSPTNDPNYGKLVMFSGNADFVSSAHALLNKDSELGRGGFGIVYRTMLRDGRLVAIKKLTLSNLIKSQEEFEKEIKSLGRTGHHNVVAMEGYYWTPSLQLLIYEYISSGSLYKHLHGGTNTHCLSWRQRFNIIIGMAKGLAHLHQMNIIHYNLKSTNILLDNNGDPKVGDFGLARLLPTLDRCILNRKFQSALGYMAPEFACRTVKITKKCDIYGFGILILEIVTGKRPVEYMEDDVVLLFDMVRGSLEDGRIEDCIDERLAGNFPADEAIPVIKLGLICASQVPSDRPEMEEVINILEMIQSPAEGRVELE